MQKVPEFAALGVGFGLLGLAGAIAWTTLEPQAAQDVAAQAIRQVTPDLPAAVTSQAGMQQAALVPAVRR